MSTLKCEEHLFVKHHNQQKSNCSFILMSIQLPQEISFMCLTKKEPYRRFSYPIPPAPQEAMYDFRGCWAAKKGTIHVNIVCKQFVILFKLCKQCEIIKSESESEQNHIHAWIKKTMQLFFHGHHGTTTLHNMHKIMHHSLVYSVQLRYWTYKSWSINTCQNKVSADQHHETILPAQAKS